MRFGDFLPASIRDVESAVAGILNEELSWDLLLRPALPQAESSALRSSGARQFRRFSEESKKVFIETLRELVEDWIQSGIDNGVENSWKRVVPEALLNEFWKESILSASQGSDGQIRLVIVSVDFDPRTWALRLARCYFAKLLDSACRECLSRCMKCRRFFVRSRRPMRRMSTKLGTYCPDHSDQRKRTGMNDVRQKRKRKLCSLAAGLSEQYEREHPRQRREKWIAHQMNRELRKFPEQYYWNPLLTSRWVARNEYGIQTAREEFKRKRQK